MVVNESPFEHPDDVIPTVGSQGLRQRQEPTSGKPINRLGAESAEADIDIGTSNNPTNIGSNGSEFQSGARSTGGAQELTGTVVSDQGNNFDIHIDWLDDNDNLLRTESPSAIQGVNNVDNFNIVTKSDRFELRITDVSGNATNEIHGSANAH